MISKVCTNTYLPMTDEDCSIWLHFKTLLGETIGLFNERATPHVLYRASHQTDYARMLSLVADRREQA